MKKITVREYDRKAEELLKRILSDAKPFADDSPAGKEARREKSLKDFFYFCENYLPHHFEDAFDRNDVKMLRLLKNWNEVFLFEAFRGWGKSTKLIVGYGIWATLKKLTHYITVTSDTEDQAIDLAMPVRVELQKNPRIAQDFGNLASHDWAEDAFVTTSGVKWQCFGWKSKYRGRRYLQYRPGIGFVDDLDNDDNVRNASQVKKRIEHVTQTMVPAMGEKFQLIVSGTRLARYCVVSELAKNPEIKYFCLPAEDRNGNPTTPGRFPKERLDKLKKLIGTIAYAKEYLLKILGDETRAFQDEWFQFIPGAESNYKYIVSFNDPSVGSNQSNDFKAIITVGWNGTYYDVIDAFIRKTTIDHMIRANYARYAEFRPHVVGLETNGFQVLLKREFQRAAKDEGYQLPIKPVVQKENKESRILRLSPMIENGMIRFCKNGGDMNLLTEQLLDFPDGAHDDGPDALEAAINLLQKLAGKNSNANIEVF